jgi:hypothetical protein
MMLNLDIAAGVLTGWIALALFSLHVISSPRHRTWMTIPEYVRRGFLVTGAMFTWRSVNLFSVAGSDVILGHINAEGMMALISVTYTVSALAWWIFTGLLPARTWERLQWAQRHARDHAETVPLMMTQAEVANVARASGTPTVGPNEGPEAVEREAAHGRERPLRRPVDPLLGREGGYVEQPSDAGGETNWGVTRAVARENGYAGPMAAMTRDQAKAIYRAKYWAKPGLYLVAPLSARSPPSCSTPASTWAPARPGCSCSAR